nr:vegetative cell wall protein gp1-like [Equus asinus]
MQLCRPLLSSPHVCNDPDARLRGDLVQRKPRRSAQRDAPDTEKPVTALRLCHVEAQGSLCWGQGLSSTVPRDRVDCSGYPCPRVSLPWRQARMSPHHLHLPMPLPQSPCRHAPTSASGWPPSSPAELSGHVMLLPCIPQQACPPPGPPHPTPSLDLSLRPDTQGACLRTEGTRFLQFSSTKEERRRQRMGRAVPCAGDGHRSQSAHAGPATPSRPHPESGRSGAPPPMATEPTGHPWKPRAPVWNQKAGPRGRTEPRGRLAPGESHRREEDEEPAPRRPAHTHLPRQFPQAPPRPCAGSLKIVHYQTPQNSRK